MPRSRCVAATVCMALAVALTGCKDGTGAESIEGFGAGSSLQEQPAGTPAASGAALQATINSVRSVQRVAPSQFEEKRAGQGKQLLVLDVSVHNRGSEARVFSEGKLVAVSGSRERSFQSPLNMLSDGFLSLQVLEPAAQARGRIVFEVPRPLQGRLYWVPGESDERIALGPVQEPGADADAELQAQVQPAPGADLPPQAPVEDAERPSAETAEPAPVRESGRDFAPAPAPAPARAPARAPAPAATGSTRTATTTVSAGASWSGASRWPPRPGPAFQCDKAWTRVEHVICGDERLSDMDWELNRAYAIARRSVADRAALQREEDSWRFNVRDECPSKACIEAAYEKRIGELYSMASR